LDCGEAKRRDSRKAADAQREEEPLSQFTWQYKVTSIDYELALYVTGIGPTLTSTVSGAVSGFLMVKNYHTIFIRNYFFLSDGDHNVEQEFHRSAAAAVK
jgi:hypothetical protein